VARVQKTISHITSTTNKCNELTMSITMHFQFITVVEKQTRTSNSVFVT